MLGNQGKAPDNTVLVNVNGPITLDPAPTKGQINLGKPGQTTEINIRGDMTIIQRDAGSANKHRIFDVLANTTVKLTYLELKNGKVDYEVGGAVRSGGNLTVDGCIFRQNEAMNSFGGAIAAVGGSLDVHGVSQFTGNSATYGGAVYIGERIPADISYTEFVLNTASGQGGAIYILSSTTAEYTTVTLDNVDVNGNVSAGRGSGIMVSTIGQGAGTALTLSSTHIRNNVVTSQIAEHGRGGGVYFGAGTVALLGVVFEDNSALSGDGMYRRTGTMVAPFPFVTYINDSEVVGP